MRLLDLTLPTPAENLALDEAILEEAELGSGPDELLRLWEPLETLVVIGRSSRIAREVNLSACRADNVPVLRRCSGGAAIVSGPGCLMYAVVLSYREHPELRVLDQAHQYVLGVMQRALVTLRSDVELLGTSDLTRRNRKFSGNSLRCKRDHLLYHGTILYDFPLSLIGRYLGTPPRQPDYRCQRQHEAFVDNFPTTREELRVAICKAWAIDETVHHWPRTRVEQLVLDRYSQPRWNERL